MKLTIKNNESWRGEYKKYRSTDEHIQQNQEANRVQRERDNSAARGECTTQKPSVRTPDERVVPAANAPRETSPKSFGVLTR